MSILRVCQVLFVCLFFALAGSAQPASYSVQEKNDGTDPVQQHSAPGEPAQQGKDPAQNVQSGWHQFRGPAGLATSHDKGLPVKWSDEENIVWKTPLPGAGTSSPVVWGDRIFLTCHTGYGVSRDNPGEMNDLKRFVLCLDRKSGKILWKKEVESVLPESAYESRMLWHGYASSTPVVDAELLYCFFGRSGVFAFDHDGKKLWHTGVGDKIHGWGSAASPILYKDLVIINAFVECGDLIALNKKTGKEVWRARGLNHAWNTPLLVALPGGKKELVVGILGKVLGFDPDTGKELWSCKGLDWYIVGSLVAHDGVVYCTAGRSYGTIAVRAGGRGDVSNSHLVWRSRKGSNVSSPVYHDGHVYIAHESQSVVYCFDARDGKIVYEESLPRRVGYIYASPIVADGKIYFVSREGGTLVVRAAPKYELLAHNRFAGDRSIFNASPVVDSGRLLLRSDRYLYCIGEKK